MVGEHAAFLLVDDNDGRAKVGGEGNGFCLARIDLPSQHPVEWRVLRRHHVYPLAQRDGNRSARGSIGMVFQFFSDGWRYSHFRELPLKKIEPLD